MGSGMAKSISDKWPEVYQADIAGSLWADPDKLGTFTACQVPNGPLVYNLYTQFRYGRDKQHTEYEAVKKALHNMRIDLCAQGRLQTCKLGTYRLGCIRGGGDWSIVSKMIDDVFHDIDIHVYDREDIEDLHTVKQKILVHWQNLHSQPV